MPRYERDGEARVVELHDTALHVTISKPGGWLRRKLTSTTEKTQFDSSRDARLAFVHLTRELREAGFVCVEEPRKRSATNPIAAATRTKFASFVEEVPTAAMTAAGARVALSGLYELRAALEASKRGEFFADTPGLLEGLDPEPRIRQWEDAVRERYGALLSPLELETRELHEQQLAAGALPDEDEDGELDEYVAMRALGALFGLRGALARHAAGDYFSAAPGILVDLDPEPLLAHWQALLASRHGEVGRAFYAEVASDNGVLVEGVEQRTDRRRGTFRPPRPPRSGRGFDRAGDGDAALLELEERLLEERDDSELYAVYADRLQEVGNRFGDFIARELAAEARGEARGSWPETLGEDGTLVLGPLAEIERSGIELTWRHGFVRRARFASMDNDELVDGVASLLECRAGSLLSELVLGMLGDYELDYHAAIEVIAESGPHKGLRRLVLGDFEYPDEIEMSWAIVGDVSALWEALPDLRELTLQGSEIELGDILAPSLRRLTLRTGGLPGATIEEIARAELDRLEELELWLGDDGYGATATVDQVAALLASPRMPALQILRLRNAEIADDIARQLAGSPLIEQLAEIDLSMGVLSAEGAGAILDNIARFSHLEKLDVSDNFLDAASIARLQAYDFVVCGEQKEDEDDFRYVTVSE